MIKLNEDTIKQNLDKLIDGVDLERLRQAAKDQPRLRSFFLSYHQELLLIDFLEQYFDSVRKPTDEAGSEKSADAICLKDGKEFRFQLKQIVTDSIRTMNGIKDNGKTKIKEDIRLFNSHIISKSSRERLYERSELDVMVADVSSLFGTTKFLYKLIDNFESSPKGCRFIVERQKIKFNPVGHYQDHWVENFDEIMKQLLSNSYPVRSYTGSLPMTKYFIPPVKEKDRDLFSM